MFASSRKVFRICYVLCCFQDGVHKTPTHSRSERYIRHQIYGDFPSVQIQDDLTLDAFETRSPWSFSQNDSPFTTRKETKVNDDEISDQVLKGDVPLGQALQIISTQCYISYRNQSFGLHCKLNGWLLYEMQCWAKMC